MVATWPKFLSSNSFACSSLSLAIPSPSLAGAFRLTVVLVLAGTRKGLFLLESDEGRRDWKVEGPLLPGWEVFHAILDPRDDTLYACTNTYAYGANVHRSKDRGETWAHAEQLGLPEDGELKLEKTWHIEPGRDSELWLGGAPGVLFRSGDGGVSWDLVRGLFEHPTR